MASAVQTTTGKGIDWRQWAGRLAAAASSCWRRVAAWFSTPPTPSDLRVAERRRRKQIKRQLRQRA
jgi:hypothetical protein